MKFRTTTPLFLLLLFSLAIMNNNNNSKAFAAEDATMNDSNTFNNNNTFTTPTTAKELEDETEEEAVEAEETELSNSLSSLPLSSPPTLTPTTTSPTFTPTSLPSVVPSTQPPTSLPSIQPSTSPPTLTPSTSPSLHPSPLPSVVASTSPSLSTSPSFSPTMTFSPSLEPSTSPTTSPSTSNQPSFSPSLSLQPSESPSLNPTYSPVIAPSTAPSLSEEVSYSRSYIQRLLVSETHGAQSFGMDQIQLYEFLYRQYTEFIGYGVKEPSIGSECVVLSQQIGSSLVRGAKKKREGGMVFHARRLWRKFVGLIAKNGLVGREEKETIPIDADDGLLFLETLKGEENVKHDDDLGIAIDIDIDPHSNMKHQNNRQLQEESNDEESPPDETTPTTPPPSPPSGYPLTMRFTMRYSTRVGVYDISTYNQLFRQYVNANLPKVTNDLQLLGLPVVSAGEVLILNNSPPTKKPTLAPVPDPTLRPTTMNPTKHPTISPTTTMPTELPSDIPSEQPPPFIEEVITNNTSFILGVSFGLVGAFLVSCMIWFHVKRQEKRKMDAEELERLRRREAQSVSLSSSRPPYHGGYPGSSSKQYPPSGSSYPPHMSHQHQHYHQSFTVGMMHKDGSEDNIDNGAASKTTVELTPNEDEAYDGGEHLQQHGGGAPQSQQQQQASPPQYDNMGNILNNIQDPHYGGEGQKYSPGLGGPQHSGMLQPLDPISTTTSAGMMALDVEHGDHHQHQQHQQQEQMYQQQQHPYVARDEDGMVMTGASTMGPEMSERYNNLFRYESEGYDISPGVEGSQQQPGMMPPQQQQQSSMGMMMHPQQMEQMQMHQQYMQQRHPQTLMQLNTSSEDGSSSLPNNSNNNHHIMIHNTSFSSSSDNSVSLDDHDDILGEHYHPSAFDGSTDELDNYKNQDLETLRTNIENAVDGVEGMMSLAMTRALTEQDPGASLDLPWAGAADHGSIEASCLCETYDWLKRHKECSLEEINEYFQDILNRIVITVMFGMTSPLCGASLVHACATILGLDLLQELPQKTLVITGMRKTNDLAQGHNFIVKAFKPFGKIEEAAIAPNNRGFGFVRFTKPESVKRAIKKYREFEIEIQDVSVSIKTLKSERPR